MTGATEKGQDLVSDFALWRQDSEQSGQRETGNIIHIPHDVANSLF